MYICVCVCVCVCVCLTSARERPGELLNMDLAKVGVAKRVCEIAPEGIVMSLLWLEPLL